jgi:hypothetical protein
MTSINSHSLINFYHFSIFNIYYEENEEEKTKKSKLFINELNA